MSDMLRFVYSDDAEGGACALREHLEDPAARFSHEARCLAKSGEERWFHAQGICVANGEGQPKRFVVLPTDAGEREDLEATLLARQRLEAIGQLSGGIAHEFNYLSTVIQGNIELLKEVRLVDEDLTNSIVDVAMFVTGTRDAILQILGEDIDVHAVVPEGLWSAHVGPGHLEAAVLNVAINARNVMPTGGVLVLSVENRSIRPDARELWPAAPAGDYVEISVSATGKGMNAETCLKAFEPFFTTKDVGEGSGLGLSTVLGFSRQSGGKARLENTPGEGTRVALLLPRSTVRADPIAAILDGSHRAEKAEHVHILEDNPHVRTTLVRLIESLGLSVSTSDHARAAMKYAAADQRRTYFLQT